MHNNVFRVSGFEIGYFDVSFFKNFFSNDFATNLFAGAFSTEANFLYNGLRMYELAAKVFLIESKISNCV